jgi:hypothetical protein
MATPTLMGASLRSPRRLRLISACAGAETGTQGLVAGDYDAIVIGADTMTPIRGLFLAGASTHPGGGVHGAPGMNAARAAVAARHRPVGMVVAAAGAALGRRSRS